jgi:N-acetylglucosamine-6-phosphate deacetylase
VAPTDIPDGWLDSVANGLAVVTIAPELPGAPELIELLAARGVAVSLGHSAADLDAARAGYARGARSTTHLFNAMTGIEHRAPGLAVAALEANDVFVELIADGHHVHPALWPLIARLKPRDRLMLVSDALSLAGTGGGRARVGGLEVEVVDGRATLAGTTTLAGSVIALDAAVRNLVAAGIRLPDAVAAASTNPASLLGATDRGLIATGLHADLVELDDDLQVRRVMRGGMWIRGTWIRGTAA